MIPSADVQAIALRFLDFNSLRAVSLASRKLRKQVVGDIRHKYWYVRLKADTSRRLPSCLPASHSSSTMRTASWETCPLPLSSAFDT